MRQFGIQVRPRQWCPAVRGRRMPGWRSSDVAAALGVGGHSHWELAYIGPRITSRHPVMHCQCQRTGCLGPHFKGFRDNAHRHRRRLWGRRSIESCRPRTSRQLGQSGGQGRKYLGSPPANCAHIIWFRLRDPCRAFPTVVTPVTPACGTRSSLTLSRLLPRLGFSAVSSCSAKRGSEDKGSRTLARLATCLPAHVGERLGPPA